MLFKNSYAKKDIYPLEVIIGLSDLIVVGEIVSVDNKTYKFKITETVKGGDGEESIIKVIKFEEWICDRRLEQLKNGQRLILFLTKKGKKHEVINGSSGEIFIKENKLITLYYNQSPNLDEFINAIKLFVTSYKLKIKNYESLNETVFVQLVSDNEIDVIIKNSKLYSLMVNRMKYFTVEKRSLIE